MPINEGLFLEMLNGDGKKLTGCAQHHSGECNLGLNEIMKRADLSIFSLFFRLKEQGHQPPPALAAL